MAGEGPSIGPPPDRAIMVEGVIIPDVLDLHTSTDPNAFPVYWMLRRYHTAFPLSLVSSQIEPIRAKVESTQDLSLLTEDELIRVRTINNIYNSDIDGFGFVRTVSAL